LLISSFVVTVLACTAVALCGESIRPGDTVKVTARTAPVLGGEKTLTTVRAGTELKVIEVRENWVGVTAEKDGKKITGWIDKTRLKLVAAKDVESPPKLVNLDKVTPEAGDVKELVGCRVFGRVRVVAIEPNKTKLGMFLIITAKASERTLQRVSPRGVGPSRTEVSVVFGDKSIYYQVQCLLAAPEETALRLKVRDMLTVAGTVTNAEIKKKARIYDEGGRLFSSGTLIRLELSGVKTNRH